MAHYFTKFTTGWFRELLTTFYKLDRLALLLVINGSTEPMEWLRVQSSPIINCRRATLQLFCYFADISENERKMATISILSLCIPWVWSPASGRPITNASPSSSSSEIMRRYCDMIGLVMMKSPFTDAWSPSTDKHAPNCC